MSNYNFIYDDHHNDDDGDVVVASQLLSMKKICRNMQRGEKAGRKLMENEIMVMDVNKSSPRAMGRKI